MMNFLVTGRNTAKSLLKKLILSDLHIDVTIYGKKLPDNN